MTVELRKPRQERYESLDPAITPLKPGSPPGALPHRGAAHYARPYGSARQNGRVEALLPAGGWTRAWTMPLSPGYIPRAVLAADNRILVQGDVWELVDPEGGAVANGKLGVSSITIAPAHDCFYHMSETGGLLERSLEDGVARFKTLPFLGAGFSRPLIHRNGNRLLLVGNERQMDSRGRKRACRSLIEWIDLGAPERLSYTGLLLSAANAGTLILPSPRFSAAADDGQVIGISDGRVYVSEAPGALSGVFGGDFEALTLSLGGNGLAYAVVRLGSQLALWAIAFTGEIVRTFSFPEDIGRVVAPPVAGRDGGLYLATPHKILALDPDWRIAWEHHETSMIVGATSDGNGSLAVSAVYELGLLSPEGSYLSIDTGGQRNYCTPPCVTPDGAIAVASNNTLYLYRAG